MSINDFKNFISLSKDEKQLLLDKLFNLEVINILNGILKDINKINKKKLTALDSEISTLEQSINSIKRSIKKSLEKEKENLQSEIDEIVKEAKSKKDEYIELKKKVDKIKEKENILKNELDKEKRQLINTNNDIRNVQKEINLYDSGKCPTCATDFNSERFQELRASLVDKKKSYQNVVDEIETNISNLKAKQTKLNKIASDTTESFNDLNYLLKNSKARVNELKAKQKNSKADDDSVNISEFKNTIKELNDKKDVSSEQVSERKEKELYYKELNRIFGEEGVKKSIIKNIIKPINHFINENINKMGLHFEVVLDETFTAEIKSLGRVIDHDSLSTGETKKINICILIAYLKLIKTKKNINILFLDEVFSSLDLDGIDSILLLLKSFAEEYNTNIFVVHHAILSQEMFDKIIQVNKDVFSSIEEIEY
jgi:DNA repair exonuclease SbcCD ATPase subunit